MSRFAALLRRAGPASVLALLACTLPPIGSMIVLGFLVKLGPWLRSHEGLGLAIYLVAFWILGGFGLMATYAYSALAGWTFGFRLGLPAALGAFVGAALVAYVIGRLASRDRVTRMIAENPKWQAVYEALLAGGFWRSLGIVTILRLPPTAPFAISNVIFAATRTPVIPYALGTLLGLAPRTAAVVFAAKGLKTLTLEETASPMNIVLGLVGTVLAVLVVGHIANRAVQRVTGQAR